MTRRLITFTVTALVALIAVGGALAARDGKVLYRFVGQMQSAPGRLVAHRSRSSRATARRSARCSASPRCRRSRPTARRSSSAGRTASRRWCRSRNVVQGDYVSINVRRAALAAARDRCSRPPARLVGDRGQELGKPANPLFLFRGTIASSAAGSVTVDVTGGNAARAPAPGRAGRHADLRDRRRDDLPPLAGPRPDGDRRLAADRRRPGRRARPRRRRLVAGRRCIDDPRAPRRRARAGREGGAAVGAGLTSLARDRCRETWGPAMPAPTRPCSARPSTALSSALDDDVTRGGSCAGPTATRASWRC